MSFAPSGVGYSCAYHEVGRMLVHPYIIKKYLKQMKDRRMSDYLSIIHSNLH